MICSLLAGGGEMSRRIQGRDYNFEIVSYNGGYLFCFYIRAICKFTKRTSCINNLNPVLSEFGISQTNPKYVDSMWEVTEKEAKRFVKTAIGFISNPTFLSYLEGKLDEDRMEGEWERILEKV